MGKKGKEIRGQKEERDQFNCYYRVCYRIAGNFCKHKFLRITNKHTGNKFPDFSFHDKVTMSDHTLYNFLRENGDPQRVFQHQNDSKTLL